MSKLERSSDFKGVENKMVPFGKRPEKRGRGKGLRICPIKARQSRRLRESLPKVPFQDGPAARTKERLRDEKKQRSSQENQGPSETLG